MENNMAAIWKKLTPLILLFTVFSFIEGGLLTDYADARSKSGGKSFSSAPSKAPANSSATTASRSTSGGFGRGMMGGLLGGALGGLLFGSMFGAAGSGFGLLPLLLLGGAAFFFLYRKYMRSGQTMNSQGPGLRSPLPPNPPDFFGGNNSNPLRPSPPAVNENPADAGISQIQMTDRDFDPRHFVEVASDVFFKVQAGWMRRDLASYRHLLGEQLAQEYENHFEEMRQNGHINKLESIAVRGVEIVEAGSDGREDFVTVRFSANLLDYTVNDKTGELISGSMTEPVKFREDWTWARPVNTQNWRLEGIQEG